MNGETGTLLRSFAPTWPKQILGQNTARLYLLIPLLVARCHKKWGLEFKKEREKNGLKNIARKQNERKISELSGNLKDKCEY